MTSEHVPHYDLRNRASAERVGADWQAGIPIHLTATAEWAQSAQGQLLLLHLANQLPRMGPGYRRISVSPGLEVPLHPQIRRWCGNQTLVHALLHRMRAIVPGEYSVELAETDVQGEARRVRVWVGQPSESLSASDVSIITDNWTVTVTVGNTMSGRRGHSGPLARERYNPISAQWAVAGLCALLYQRYSIGASLGSVYEWTCWPPSLPFTAPRVEDIDIGRVVLIGCGAVGNAFLEVLRTWPGVSGSLTLYDPETADETNLNRYLLLDRHGAGRAKVAVAKTALATMPHLSVRGFEREISDGELTRACRIVLAVDRIAPRLRIQASWPDLLLEAGTGQQWFHVAHCHRRLISSERVACQSCIHGKGVDLPREEREAATVFVSALTGAVLAREFLLTLKAGLEAAAHSNRVDGNAFEPGYVESTRQESDPQCDMCRKAQLV